MTGARRSSMFDVAKFETRMALLLGKIDQATEAALSSSVIAEDDETVMDADLTATDAATPTEDVEACTEQVEVFDNAIPDQMAEASTSPVVPVTSGPTHVDVATTPLRITPTAHVDAGTCHTPVQCSDFATMTSPMVRGGTLSEFVAGADHDTLVEQMETLTFSNDVLRKDQAALQKQIAKSEKTLAEAKAQLQGEITKGTQTKAELKSKEAEWASMRDRQQSTLNELRQEYDALKHDVTSTVAEKDAELEQMEASMDEMRRSIAQQMSVIASLEGRLGEAAHGAQARAVELEAAKAKLESALQEQVTLNKNMQVDLRTMYKSHQKEVAELQAEYHNQAYKEQYLRLLDENRRLQARIERLLSVFGNFATIDALEAQAQDTAAATMAAIHHASSDVLAQRRDIEKMQYEMQVEAVQLQERLLAAEDMRALLAQHEGLTVPVVADMIASLTELTSSDSAASAIEHVRNTYALCDELDAKANALEDQVSALEQARAADDCAIQQAQADLSAANTKIATLQSDLETLTAKDWEATTESAEMHVALEAVRGESDAIKAELASARATMHTLQGQVAEKIAQYNELKEFFEDERNIRQDMINELERDVAAANDHVVQLQQV